MLLRSHYIERILRFKDKPIIKVITGLRRCGKSTILEQFMNHIVTLGTNQKRLIYINMELLKFSHIQIILFSMKRLKRH